MKRGMVTLGPVQQKLGQPEGIMPKNQHPGSLLLFP